MSAVIVSGQKVTVIHDVDLFDKCRACGAVHHEEVVTITTADEWFAPLPVTPRVTLRSIFISHALGRR